MTDTFTIKDLKIAYGKAEYKELNSIIAELTRTHWKPQAEEVYLNGNDIYMKMDGAISVAVGSRSLTPDEVPALNVAINLIQSMSMDNDHTWTQMCKNVLAQIKEITGEH